MNRREFFALLLTPLFYVVRPRPDVWAIVDAIWEREKLRPSLTGLIYGASYNTATGRIVTWGWDEREYNFWPDEA
jgi:hypothetical protein